MLNNQNKVVKKKKRKSWNLANITSSKNRSDDL